MSERDVMTLLTNANPVRVDDLTPQAFPGLSRGRSPRLALAVSVTGLSALAAILLAVYSLDGSSTRPGTRNTGSTKPHSAFPVVSGPGLGPGSPRTVEHPLGGGSEVSLADAQAALGPRIVLPDTSRIGSPAIGPVWLSRGGPAAVVAVTYPSVGMWVDYVVGANRYYDDVLLQYRAIANEDPAGSRVLDLDGVPALASEAKSGGETRASIMFDIGGTRVTIIGHQGLPELQVLARSIVAGSARPSPGQLGNAAGVQLFPPLADARQLSLGTASATLGAPLVIPDTSIADQSDVGQVWAEGRCPASGATAVDAQDGRACWIWVSFPSAGLTVGYLRPPMYPGGAREWKLQARLYGSAASVIDVRGVAALAIAPEGPFPGSVEFDLAGSRIVVAGDRSVATLQSVAQSIVDRSK